jgi:hypothetical protein
MLAIPPMVDRLGEGTWFAGLQRQHRGRSRQFLKYIRGLAGRKSGDDGCKHLVDEPGPVFRSNRRKIRPDLSPAGEAIIIFHADEDGRPIKHTAE